MVKKLFTLESPSTFPVSTTPYVLPLSINGCHYLWFPPTKSNSDRKPDGFLVHYCGQPLIAPDCGCQLCKRHCRDLGECTSKNYPPKTPSRTATFAPPFFTPLPPNHLLPSIPPSLSLMAYTTDIWLWPLVIVVLPTSYFLHCLKNGFLP